MPCSPPIKKLTVWLRLSRQTTQLLGLFHLKMLPISFKAAYQWRSTRGCRRYLLAARPHYMQTSLLRRSRLIASGRYSCSLPARQPIVGGTCVGHLALSERPHLPLCRVARSLNANWRAEEAAAHWTTVAVLNDLLISVFWSGLQICSEHVSLPPRRESEDAARRHRGSSWSQNQ